MKENSRTLAPVYSCKCYSKLRMAGDGWNTRDHEKVALAYASGHRAHLPS